MCINETIFKILSFSYASHLTFKRFHFDSHSLKRKSPKLWQSHGSRLRPQSGTSLNTTRWTSQHVAFKQFHKGTFTSQQPGTVSGPSAFHRVLKLQKEIAFTYHLILEAVRSTDQRSITYSICGACSSFPADESKVMWTCKLWPGFSK